MPTSRKRRRALHVRRAFLAARRLRLDLVRRQERRHLLDRGHLAAAGPTHRSVRAHSARHAATTKAKSKSRMCKNSTTRPRALGIATFKPDSDDPAYRFVAPEDGNVSDSDSRFVCRLPRRPAAGLRLGDSQSRARLSPGRCARLSCEPHGSGRFGSRATRCCGVAERK